MFDPQGTLDLVLSLFLEDAITYKHGKNGGRGYATNIERERLSLQDVCYL